MNYTMIDLLKPLSELRGKNIAGIYLIEINSHKYVGSSRNIKKRLRTHRAMLKNNRHDNIYMQRSFNKCKTASYKILEEVVATLSTIDLRILEKKWVKDLKADLNLDDPVLGIGGSIKKKVYQYTMNGIFIKEWKSPVDASIELNVPYWGIHNCANPNTIVKSAYGSIWSYVKKDHIDYSNNTGCNLQKKEVHVYDLNLNYIKSYPGLSEFARKLAEDIGYTKHWTNLRSATAYVIAKPTTRTLIKKYKVFYNKI